MSSPAGRDELWRNPRESEGQCSLSLPVKLVPGRSSAVSGPALHQWLCLCVPVNAWKHFPLVLHRIPHGRGLWGPVSAMFLVWSSWASSSVESMDWASGLEAWTTLTNSPCSFSSGYSWPAMWIHSFPLPVCSLWMESREGCTSDSAEHLLSRPFSAVTVWGRITQRRGTSLALQFKKKQGRDRGQKQAKGPLWEENGKLTEGFTHSRGRHYPSSKF